MQVGLIKYVTFLGGVIAGKKIAVSSNKFHSRAEQDNNWDRRGAPDQCSSKVRKMFVLSYMPTKYGTFISPEQLQDNAVKIVEKIKEDCSEDTYFRLKCTDSFFGDIFRSSLDFSMSQPLLNYDSYGNSKAFEKYISRFSADTEHETVDIIVCPHQITEYFFSRLKLSGVKRYCKIKFKEPTLFKVAISKDDVCITPIIYSD